MRLPIVFQCQCRHAEHQCDPSIPGCPGGSPGRSPVPREGVRGGPAGPGSGRDGSGSCGGSDGLSGLSEMDDPGDSQFLLVSVNISKTANYISINFLCPNLSFRVQTLNLISSYKYFLKQSKSRKIFNCEPNTSQQKFSAQEIVCKESFTKQITVSQTHHTDLKTSKTR